MQETIVQLRQILDSYSPMFSNINDESWYHKPLPGKWSKSEILGHLVDSAQNNLRRFIVAQYEENPVITYRQDDWVKLSAYADYNREELVGLWLSLNRHICVVLHAMPAPHYSRTCKTGQLHSIEWLAQDYVKHLLHHLHQVLNLEPMPYS